MAERSIYRFAGTDGPVDVTGCDAVSRYFPAVFPNWPHEQLGSVAANAEPVLQLSNAKSGFHLSSDQYELDQQLNDPLNAACSIVAELAWARLRAEPDLLCFHGAAIEYNGSLVLIPSQRRAGKSTLTACLLARGRRLFTDDFLPLRLGEDGRLYGIANGAAPRLRLPLPEEFSPKIKRQIMALAGPQNRQYLYLTPKEGQLAEHGECLPVSAVVLLERADGHESDLREAQPAQLLRRLILQNFSRHMNPARILGIIGHMAKHTQGLRLCYSNAEEASEVLDAYLDKITRQEAPKPARLEAPLAPADFTLPEAPRTKPVAIDASRAYHQTQSAFELDLETDSFVASSEGGGIHHLNSFARAVWGLLSDPMSVENLVDLFSEAFPEQAREALHKDMSKTLRFLRDQQLIEPVSTEQVEPS